MKYALIELSDDFEKGCCQDCPLSYTEWFDDDEYTDCQDVCVLNSRYDECPLDIRTERIPFDFELYEAGLMDMPKKMIEVLDKIRAEIERQEKWLMIVGYNAYNVDVALNAIKLAVAESEDI